MTAGLSRATEKPGSGQEQLARLVRAFRHSSDSARLLCTGLAAERLTARASPGSWSIAECLTHLSLTTEAFLPRMEEGLESARRQELKSAGPYGMGIFSRFFVRVLEPPALLRFRTTAPFQPVEIGPVYAVLPRFLAGQEKLIGFARRSEGSAIDRVKVDSPFRKGVSYTIYAALCILEVHERRHLWQGEKTRRHLQ